MYVYLTTKTPQTRQNQFLEESCSQAIAVLYTLQYNCTHNALVQQKLPYELQYNF